jgi:hypothetical protein
MKDFHRLLLGGGDVTISYGSRSARPTVEQPDS